MLQLAPYDTMERFAAYAKERGVTLDPPCYPERINEPETTGWIFEDGSKRKFVFAVEQQRVTSGLWTLEGGPYFLYMDGPPPHGTTKVLLGEINLGDRHEWDLRVQITEEDLNAAFSEIVERVLEIRCGE